MTLWSSWDFDIDVDLSELLGAGPSDDALVSGRWYELVAARPGRPPELQAKIEQIFHNKLLQTQWSATSRRALDRRCAVRVPLLSRVQVERGDHLVACDISVAGLRCSGRPLAPVMDVEFRVPGLGFPVAAKVEVVSYKDATVLPLVGMRFASIERPYREHIAHYVSVRREKLLKAA